MKPSHQKPLKAGSGRVMSASNTGLTAEQIRQLFGEKAFNALEHYRLMVTRFELIKDQINYFSAMLNDMRNQMTQSPEMRGDWITARSLTISNKLADLSKEGALAKNEMERLSDSIGPLVDQHYAGGSEANRNQARQNISRVIDQKKDEALETARTMIDDFHRSGNGFKEQDRAIRTARNRLAGELRAKHVPESMVQQLLKGFDQELGRVAKVSNAMLESTSKIMPLVIKGARVTGRVAIPVMVGVGVADYALGNVEALSRPRPLNISEMGEFNYLMVRKILASVGGTASMVARGVVSQDAIDEAKRVLKSHLPDLAGIIDRIRPQDLFPQGVDSSILEFRRRTKYISHLTTFAEDLAPFADVLKEFMNTSLRPYFDKAEQMGALAQDMLRLRDSFRRTLDEMHRAIPGIFDRGAPLIQLVPKLMNLQSPEGMWRISQAVDNYAASIDAVALKMEQSIKQTSGPSRQQLEVYAALIAEKSRVEALQELLRDIPQNARIARIAVANVSFEETLAPAALAYQSNSVANASRVFI